MVWYGAMGIWNSIPNYKDYYPSPSIAIALFAVVAAVAKCQ